MKMMKRCFSFQWGRLFNSGLFGFEQNYLYKLEHQFEALAFF